MLYGELGRFPISLTIKIRQISFWSKLVSNEESKLSLIMYRLLYNNHIRNNCQYGWITKIKSIFEETGLNFMWMNQNINTHTIRNQIGSILKDQFRQKWHQDVDASSKCCNYKIFKTEHKFETYLIKLPHFYLKQFINYRLCNNKLPIETGRWNGVDRHLRKCTLCNDEVGDEYHYVFNCKSFDTDRKRIAPFINKRLANTQTFSYYFNDENIVRLKKTCSLLALILKRFSTPGS